MPSPIRCQSRIPRCGRHERPYLTDVTLDWGGLDVRDVYPRAVPDVTGLELLVGHLSQFGDTSTSLLMSTVLDRLRALSP